MSLIATDHRRRQRWPAWGAPLGIAILLSVIGCETIPDTGVGPEPTRTTIYIAALSFIDEQPVDPLFFCDAETLEIYDSIASVGTLYELKAAPGGRYLYGLLHRQQDADSIIKIDVTTKTRAWTVRGGDPNLTLLKNGEWLLSANQELIRTADGQTIQTYADSLTRWEGPIEGTEVAAVVGMKGNRVRVVDLATGVVHGRFDVWVNGGYSLEIYRALLLPDRRTVVAVGTDRSWYNSYIVFGDAETGESLLEQRIFSPSCRFALNDDRTRLAISDPGGTILENGPTGIELYALDPLERLGRDGQLKLRQQVKFIPGTSQVVTAPIPVYWSSAPVVVTTGSPTVYAPLTLPLPEPLIGAIAAARSGPN